MVMQIKASFLKSVMGRFQCLVQKEFSQDKKPKT
jgi:hypothetical protein